VKLAQKLNSMRNVMLVNEQLQLALDNSVLSNVYAMPRAQLVESLVRVRGRVRARRKVRGGGRGRVVESLEQQPPNPNPNPKHPIRSSS